MSKTVIKVEKLQIDYLIEGKDLPVVSDIDFTIEEGKTLGIVGESGCGKTVTASSILRLLPKGIGKIKSGKILFDGIDIAQIPEQEMRKIRGNQISMIFQNPMTSLNPVYTIGQQLLEGLLLHEKISKKDAFKHCVDILQEVGITAAESCMNSYPHQLSGGMKQRVMIAMALLSNPALLIADEPTTALDVTIQAQVLDLIKQLQKKFGTAVLFISHDMGVVSEMSDYVAVMYAGKIVEYDSMKGLFENPKHPYTCGLLKAIPQVDQDIDELYTISGEVPALDEMPTGCRFQERCEKCCEKCKLKEPPIIEMEGGKKISCWLYCNDEKDEKLEE